MSPSYQFSEKYGNSHGRNDVHSLAHTVSTSRYTECMKTLSILALLTLVLAPESAFAIHKSYVAGQVIDSSDRGIYEAHG